MVLRPGALRRDVLKPNSLTATNSTARCLNASQELRMMLEPVFKPRLLGIESDQDACRSAMTSDDNFLAFGKPKVAGEVILHFRQSHRLGLTCPLA